MIFLASSLDEMDPSLNLPSDFLNLFDSLGIPCEMVFQEGLFPISGNGLTLASWKKAGVFVKRHCVYDPLPRVVFL